MCTLNHIIQKKLNNVYLKTNDLFVLIYSLNSFHWCLYMHFEQLLAFKNIYTSLINVQKWKWLKNVPSYNNVCNYKITVLVEVILRIHFISEFI